MAPDWLRVLEDLFDMINAVPRRFSNASPVLVPFSGSGAAPYWSR
jgi:hypothetical protein